jgi:predicted enzyme related to lactoylglutathione lyase
MASQPGYFTLAVDDLGKATAFFGAVLGWEFETGEDSAHISNIDLPGGLHTTASDPHSTLYFSVDDLDAALALVRDNGGRAEDVVDSPSGRNVVCFDNQNTRFTLWEPAPGYR